MITAYNKRTRLLSQVEAAHLLRPASDWVVNPVIPDEQALRAAPTEQWIYEEETTVLRPMNSEELETHPDRVALFKGIKLAELEKARDVELNGGFTSSALGTPHWYDSAEADQINLMGAINITSITQDRATASSIMFSCRSAKGQPRIYAAHTNLQLRQVLADGAVVKIRILQTYAVLVHTTMSLTSVSAIQAVTWS
jgi:hypothetical protein